VKGELTMPAADRVMFIPQRPYLPLGTLKEALLYPGTQTRTDVELQELMTSVPSGIYLKSYIRKRTGAMCSAWASSSG
jgi:putative ATP-binding cassette transporter